MTLRKHGKASFAHMEDETCRLQLCFQFDVLGEKEYGFFKKWVDMGIFSAWWGIPSGRNGGN
jgi:lysyl-tRNA synthetase class 2